MQKLVSCWLDLSQFRNNSLTSLIPQSILTLSQRDNLPATTAFICNTDKRRLSSNEEFSVSYSVPNKRLSNFFNWSKIPNVVRPALKLIPQKDLQSLLCLPYLTWAITVCELEKFLFWRAFINSATHYPVYNFSDFLPLP